ncbi:MAG TPA: ferritin-like domain-containing protein [Acidimicrobiales bacterium]
MSATRSVDQVDMGLPASFVWDYDQSRPPVARLYERAKAGQWNPAVDLDWMVDVDPGAEPPPEARGLDWSQLGGPLADRLAADRILRHEFAAQQHGWLISQFMHGEQGALLAAAKICAASESLDDKLFAAVQVGDEARHVEAYQRYLGKIGITYPCSPPLAELLGQVMRHKHVDLTYLGMQILVEGVALAAFSMGGSLTTNPLIARLTELVRRDEARHVAFGVLSLQGFYDDMDPVDLREREDFVVESCALLRDRLLPVEVWEHFGIDTTVATARFLESAEAQGFRSVVFSKVVPNLRKLGLLTPRVRDDFETLGILRYEQYVDSATEGGELAAGELRGDARDPLKALRDSLRTVDVIPPEPVLAVFTSLVDHSRLTCVTPTRIRLRVSGVEEGDWLLTFGIGAVKYRMLRPIEGPEVADITIDLDAHTWTDLVAGRVAWYRAVIDGRVRVDGDITRLLPLDNLL